MFKKLNKKGFTLAELLIVVAIIGVLVAVSIPIFTAQLKKARLATNQANARAAYAAVVAELLDQGKSSGQDTYTVASATCSGTVATATTLGITAAPQNWAYQEEDGKTVISGIGDKTATAWTVSISDTGVVTYAATGLD